MDSLTCDVCHRDDDDDSMLVCDGCDHGFHTQCLGMGSSVPTTDRWYCRDCRIKKLVAVKASGKTLISYVRVSSPTQDQPQFGRVGIASQLSSIEAYAASSGRKIVEQFGEIGSARSPQNLETLQVVVDYGIPDGAALVVHTASRLARNESEGRKLLRRLHDSGVPVYSVSENQWSFDVRERDLVSAKFAKCLWQAQRESELLSKRMKDTYASIRSRGGHVGPAPFGKRIVRDTSTGLRHLEDHPYEMNTIRQIGFLYREVGTFRNIAEALNDVNTHNGNMHPTRDGNPWTAARVAKVWHSYDPHSNNHPSNDYDGLNDDYDETTDSDSSDDSSGSDDSSNSDDSDDDSGDSDSSDSDSSDDTDNDIASSGRVDDFVVVSDS